jgi:ADP-dependent NAD(P)H-hydrate dehydratase / NAD(P)H-hydrate epimerase
MRELLTSAEMAEADRLTMAAGVAGIELMENAGRAVADAVAARHPAGARVTVVAGPGNNGGDGFVAGRVLRERGYRVRLFLVGDASRLKGDAALAARRWPAQTEAATPALLVGAEVMIDALFGAGLDRPVQGAALDMIGAMNAAAQVFAVDLPSGINGTSGAVMGAAVNAAHTVTFFRRKTGHVLLPGRLYSGEIAVADIGIRSSVLDRIGPKTWINEPNLWRQHFPVPKPGGHKYTRGHAVVVSGPAFSTGAARLAARGALRAGAGLVTIASPREAVAINAAANLAIMVRPVDTAPELVDFLADSRRNALVLGPGVGVGQETRERVLAALAAQCAVVLDADALTSFAGDLESLADAIRKRPHPTVLTPHDGEFSRLFKEVEEKPLSKLERARRAAVASGAIILFKGADTVVAAPDGRAAIADNAPPWLATAGSGDVLAGIVGACLAQRMPGFEAAAAAVWLHGAAATQAGPGLIAEDLPEAMPGVFRNLFAALGTARRCCERG